MKFSLLIVVITVQIVKIHTNTIAIAPGGEEHLKAGECDASGVNIVYTGESILVSWTAVTTPCSVVFPSYKVQYIVNDVLHELIEPLAPGVPIAEIETGKLTCKRVSVMVEVYDGADNIGKSEIIHLERDLDDLQEVTAEQTAEGLLIKWQPLEFGESCPVTYHIQYQIQGSAPETAETSDSSFLLKFDTIIPCTVYDVLLVASSNKLDSKPFALTHEIGIPTVRELSLKNRDGKVLVNFKPPLEVPKICGDVEFMVIQEDQLCFKSDFEIIPVSSNGNEGVSVKKSIIKEPGPVQELQATPKTDKVYLEWEIPVGGVGCNMAYFIRYSGKTSSVHITSFTVPLKLEACKEDVVEVAPVILVGEDFVEGRSVKCPLVGDVGPVEELQCSLKSDLVECSWQKPQNADNCETFDYKIAYYDGNEKKEDKTSGLSYSFPIVRKLCAFWIHIQPVAHKGDITWDGEVVEAEIDACD